jgi:hypothetical protein
LTQSSHGILLDGKPIQSVMPMSVIDPPGPFAPRTRLEAFLARAKTWDQSSVAVTGAIRQVEKALARRKKMARQE